MQRKGRKCYLWCLRCLCVSHNHIIDEQINPLFLFCLSRSNNVASYFYLYSIPFFYIRISLFMVSYLFAQNPSFTFNDCLCAIKWLKELWKNSCGVEIFFLWIANRLIDGNPIYDNLPGKLKSYSFLWNFDLVFFIEIIIVSVYNYFSFLCKSVYSGMATRKFTADYSKKKQITEEYLI